MTQHFSLSGWLQPARAESARHFRHGPSVESIDAALAALRLAGRRSVRILDLGCGGGERLAHAAEHARTLGFVAVEGRGVDLSALRIRLAQAQARRAANPAVTLTFELGDPIAALAAEHDGAADLVFLSQPRPYASSPLALALQRVSDGPVLTAA